MKCQKESGEPGMGGALDRLLAILAPWVVIRWDVCLLAAYGRDSNCLLHPQLPAKFSSTQQAGFRYGKEHWVITNLGAQYRWIAIAQKQIYLTAQDLLSASFIWYTGCHKNLRLELYLQFFPPITIFSPRTLLCHCISFWILACLHFVLDHL
jgi:hypothetical protein